MYMLLQQGSDIVEAVVMYCVAIIQISVHAAYAMSAKGAIQIHWSLMRHVSSAVSASASERAMKRMLENMKKKRAAQHINACPMAYARR